MSNLKIIIVDDEYKKVEKIISILTANAVSHEHVFHATTLSIARREMTNISYDLLILDLNVPSVIGESPSASGGLDFLKMLFLPSALVKIPQRILGLTCVDDLYSKNEDEFRKLGVLLEKYDSQSQSWTYSLENTLKYLSAFHRNKLQDEFYLNVDVVILTALVDPEFEAVLQLNCNWQQQRIHNDPTIYYKGEIVNGDKKFNLIAAYASRKGMPSSAALATKMSVLFKPKYIVMLGICAGLKDQVNLGDIIVADPTWDWGSGKHKVHNGSSIFNIAPYQAHLEAHLRSDLQDMIRSGVVVSKVRSSWTGEVPAGSLSIKMGPVASGAGVLSDQDLVKEIKENQNKDLIGLEMEAYAVMSAVEYSVNSSPKALVIKSVCDFADEHKDDKWQKYASFTSAMTFYYFFFDLLKK